MPLPAALLARLKNRGIVQQQSEQIEEVFAEDYDDGTEQMDTQPVVPEDDFSVKIVFEIPDCKNASNPHHECSDFCKDFFGLKRFEHRSADEKRRIRMLKKYPLPPGWVEVGDPSSSRCYYWNSETDKVSWLPPQHPRAKITVSAEKLLSNVKVTSRLSEDSLKPGERRKPVSVSIKDPGSKRQGRQNKKAEELDPMDPASYSEVERGSWATGLKADVKTGVDSTASGPLFQQRPYPSPGDILRAQAAAQGGND